MQPGIDTGPHSGPSGHQDPSLPQVFGRYLLVQRLSRGGMGEIFLAKHGLAGFEKLAVIKKVLPNLAADDQFISRFVDEAQVAIKLQHVNVAQVFEVGRVGNEYFLALEYIDGRDLRRILSLLGHRKQRMPVDLALFIARDLANGLAYAHRRTAADGSSLNLVHCDISPPNVLVSFEGETKVIDFGIAKSAMRATVTDPKLGFGKFGYMAPEQLIRGGVVDHRTDLYAAGVVLFELLTGTRLYEAGPQPDYRGLARKVARGEFPLPSHVEVSLAPYDDLVATALRPRPEDRYQSAAELRDAIQHCLVAVNPTISTDPLGAYMRELFADEMAAQRELYERIASAHLADFQEQFHTQTISTVSFALAQLPLQPPEATGPVMRHLAAQALGGPPSPGVAGPSGATGARPSVPRNTATPPASLAPPSFDATAPAIRSNVVHGAIHGPSHGPTHGPTHGTIDSTIDDHAATIVGGTSYVRMRARRRRQIAIAALSASGVLALFTAWVLATNARRVPVPPADPAPVAAPAPRPQSGITVEPIPLPPPAGSGGPGEEIEMDPDDVPGAKPGADPGSGHRAPGREVVHRPAHRDVRPAPVAPPAPPPTRDQLGQKFQQIRREYDAYKAKFGSRLEKEWGDLAMFIQYASEDDAWRRDAARRLDEFRAHMRE